MTKATIFDIQRFSVHDGPGIRTTVFIKGCPIKCLWCHNPESQAPYPQLMFHKEQCIGCGKCVRVCESACHRWEEDGTHRILREACTHCGSCVQECVGALSMCGKKMTPDEVLQVVLRDRCFYENSGGGLTLSGGEPLWSIDFSYELLRLAKEAGLHTALETSGCSKWEDLERIRPFVDLFLYDYKETDSDLHKQFTGVSNHLILDNLKRLNDTGASVILRCPIIPGCNDREDHFQAIGRLADALPCITGVDIEPYHPLGRSKSLDLGMEYPLGDLSFPPQEVVASWVEKVAFYTRKTVRKS